jgi:hypothetical protein
MVAGCDHGEVGAGEVSGAASHLQQDRLQLLTLEHRLGDLQDRLEPVLGPYVLGLGPPHWR